LDWGPERLAAFLNPLHPDAFLTAPARGVIRVGAWVQEAPCEGTLEFRCLSEARIRSRLYFSAGGNPCEFVGDRGGLRPWNLHRTATTCYGVIFDLNTGKEISRSLSRFRISARPSFRMGRTLNRNPPGASLR